jgi:hypothetical protein
MFSLVILVAAAIMAGSILFIGRWQISGGDNSNMTISRLDRWTGHIDVCMVDTTQSQTGKPWTYKCPFSPAEASGN